MAGPGKSGTAVEGSASDFVLAAKSSAQMKSVVVCDAEGNVTESHGTSSADTVAAHVAVTARHLGAFGAALGLGRLEALQTMGSMSFIVLANDATLVALSPSNEISKADIDRITNRITKGLGREPVPFAQVMKQAQPSASARPEPAVIPPAANSSSRPASRGQEAKTPPPRGGRSTERQPAVVHRASAGMTSVEFEVLRKRLVETDGDVKARKKVVDEDSTAFRAWMERVPRALGLAIARGRLVEAQSIRDLAVGVADILVKDGAKIAEITLLDDFMPKVLRNMLDAEGGDAAAVAALREKEERLPPASPIKWAIALWLADGAFTIGDVGRGMDAAQKALGLVKDQDAEAEGLVLASIAEARFESGWTDAALNDLEQAKRLASTADDRPTRARLLLLEGRIHAATGRMNKSVQALEEACEVNPSYGPPYVVLARQAIKEDKLWKAEALLREAASADPTSLKLKRELKLVAEIREGKIPFMVASEYLRLDESVPSDEVVKKLQNVEAMAPDFLEAKNSLAWKLLKLGRYEDALRGFQAIAAKDSTPEMQASVNHGLACVFLARPDLRPVAQSSRPGASRPQDRGTPSAGRDSFPAAPMFSGLPTETAPPSPSVFSGELQLFPLPDLLEFLRVGRRTGALVISTPAGTGVIYLRDGMITGAASPQSQDVEQILLTKGILTKEQLDRATRQRVQQPQRLIGDILMENRLVDAAVLGEALVTQSYSAVREMVHWTSGRFAFDPDRADESTPEEVNIALDTQRVVLDVFRMLDEDSRDRMES